ncbi:MAG TPA: DUF5681 domain-containing protein [Tepidisphaeraceae bacterium]|nr:DUF5681 domain-containing protein [Tepidisphaeraceae bacterium]
MPGPGQNHRKITDKSLANLRPPFPKGKSGNPGGRPKGESLTATLRRVLEEVDPKHPDATMGERLVRMVVKHAKRGNAAIIKEIIERVDGKIPDKLEVETRVMIVDDLNDA